MKNHKRPLTIATTILACLLMVQSPASAVTHTATITGGTSTVVKSGATTLVVDLAPGTCPAGTLDADITATDISVTALSISTTYIVGGTTYVQVRTLSPANQQSSGTVSGTAISSLRVGMLSQIFALATGTTCTPTGTVICTLRSTPHFSGTITGISTGNTGHMAAPAASVSAGGPCGVPFATYIGSTVTITSLTFTT